MYKIIFVDDEAITLKLLACVLDWEALGIEIAGTASDGREALELSRKEMPDIMIADIRMPGINGVMLTELIRKSNRKMKIIFLSAYAEFEYAQSAIANNVSGYLLKPLDEEQLEALIRKVTGELAEEKEARKSSDEAKIRADGARIREAYLKWSREKSGGAEAADPGFPVKRVFCVLLGCPAEADYLSGTEDRVREALAAFSDEEYLPVPMNAYVYFILAGSEKLTSDRIVLQFGKNGLPCVCGSAAPKGDVCSPKCMEKALLAAESTFITGDAVAVSGTDPQYCAGEEPGFRDYENAIGHFAETGDEEMLRAQLAELVRSCVRERRNPDSLYTVLEDILIWLKNSIVRAYPDTELAEGALRHIDRARLRACLTPELLIRFLERLLGDLAGRIRQTTGAGGNSAVIRRARFYAAQHACEPDFSLQAAADYAGLSRSHFSKVFHDGTGVKFWDYVTELRIRNARKLLTETDLPVSGIAVQVGYETEAHLNRKFKQAEGLTPGQYRKKYGK